MWDTQSGGYKEISAETHQISDERHSFPLPEVWHAVNAIQSASHPADKTSTEQDSTPATADCLCCCFLPLLSQVVPLRLKQYLLQERPGQGCSCTKSQHIKIQTQYYPTWHTKLRRRQKLFNTMASQENKPMPESPPFLQCPFWRLFHAQGAL